MSIIVTKGHPALAHKSAPVSQSEFGSAELHQILAHMKSALSEQEDGVAIAAPQIAVEKRIFVLSPIAYGKQHAGKDLVFINPVITKFSKEKEYMVEGCLSVRWLYGDVYRSKKVFIEYQDEHGNAKSLGASGLLAQIFQHECDHLDGILFDSKAKNLEDLPPEKQAELEKKTK